MSFIRTSLLALLCACVLPAAIVVQNDIPEPSFDGRADADSYDDFGSEAATCTPTSVTFVEDPVSSGSYAVELDAASGNLSCGTGLDGLADGGTWLAWVKHDTFGEAGLGHIATKQTDATNRSWQLAVNDPGDNFVLTPINTSNVGNPWQTPIDSADPAGNYVAIGYTLSCSSTTLESCTGTAYINGAAVTTTPTGTTGTIQTGDGAYTFMIGNRPADDRTFDGRIARVAVWGAALNALQHEFLFGQGKSGTWQELFATAAITDTDCSDFSGLFPVVFDDRPESEWNDDDDACDPWPDIERSE